MIECMWELSDKNISCFRGETTCCFQCKSNHMCEDQCSLEGPFSCEKSVFTGVDLEIWNDKAAILTRKITELLQQKILIEKQEKSMREQLQIAMEEHEIKQFQNDDLKITYINATTRTSIDSKKLKEKMPDIAEQFSKTSNIKAFVKIELR